MNIENAAFERVGQCGRVLCEVLGRGKDKPGALATMSSLDEWLDVLITRSSEVAKREKLLICGAGVSRVTNISSDSNLAFKLTDIGSYERKTTRMSLMHGSPNGLFLACIDISIRKN